MHILLITFSIIGVIIVFATAGAVVTQRFVKTPFFKDRDGKVIPHSIAEFRRVEINGDKHAILIRGKSLNNPVILFLHAGPCLSETALMRKFNARLEDVYTMVYYDMRGSAKSYSPFKKYKKNFSTAILLQDIHEMTIYLKKSLGKEKVILLGHSFGAGFGALAAVKYPEDYAAFIGIGQPSNPTEMNRISYAWVLDTAQKANNQKAVNELKKADQYWELEDQKSYFQNMMVHKKWIGYYGGQMAGKTGFMQFVLGNMTGHEYNVFDYLPFLMGMMAGGPASFDIMKQTDLEKQASDFHMPVVFITGTKDYNVVPDLVKKYFNQIQAPVKKIYWIENTAHFPHIEASKRFQDIMIEEVLPLLN